MFEYVLRDLVRNPRRSLACLFGVALGVGLFSGVLFFIDAAGATMTRRAIAPLAVDMQRVLTRPLGESLRLEERVSPSTLLAGQKASVTLTVTNSGPSPANEVVVSDEPPKPLAYLRGTTTARGSAARDLSGRSPLVPGPAGGGLNIGSIPPGATVRLTYEARANRPLRATALEWRGKVSSEEELVPIPANAPRHLTLGELAARIRRIPGVAAADGLAFVDLPPGTLRSGDARLAGPVRLFAFDRRYQLHHPSIRLVTGSFGGTAAVLSAEASRSLQARAGDQVEVTLPGNRPPLTVPIGGVVDLSQAKPLFYSRKTSKLEDFLYVPNAIVVSPSTFRRVIIPAFGAARSALGTGVKSFPLLEVDVLVERSRLDSDPSAALGETTAIARSIGRIAPWQDQLIDNISNTLEVASDDARVGKRMFFFLGLPGVLLAGFLAAYAGGVLAGTQRRELATLRIRGAHRGHLLRMLAYRTGIFAGLASLLGTGLGFVSAIAILGADSVFKAASRELLVSALVATGLGMCVTALALYIPGRRSLRREVSRERAELAAPSQAGWRRWRIDLALLAAAGTAEVIAFGTGAFDTSGGSVSAGRSVSLPSHLLLAPLVAWVGGILFAARVLSTVASRLPAPAAPRFGPAVWGTLIRSVRRRASAISTGVVAVGLVVAFGTSLALFSASYDEAKAADSRFVVGSDLRVTPSSLSPSPHAPSFANELHVSGVRAVAGVVFRLENSVLIGRYNQRRTDLAAVDPSSFTRVAPHGSADAATAALRADPQGLLVDSQTADDLSIDSGDRVRVILARGTKMEVEKPFRVVGFFDAFPGFPEGANLVANLAYYDAATGSTRADFFLARSDDSSDQGLARAVAALRSGPGRKHPLNIETTETALHRDQSSLTALNINGLVDLNSLYTLLAGVAAIAIFVFGLMLQRRREYVALRAHGMAARQLQVLVFAEAAIVAVCGLAAGLVVGTGMAYFFIHILRPLFVLDPGLAFPAGEIAAFAGLAVAATLACAFVAAAILRRLRPTEILREV